MILGMSSFSALAGEPGADIRPNRVEVTAPETPPTVDLRTTPEKQPVVVETPDAPYVVEQDVNIVANPVSANVDKNIHVKVNPVVSVDTTPVTIMSEPNIKVYSGVATTNTYKPLVSVEPVAPRYPEYSVEENIYIQSEPEPTALDRFKDGLYTTSTFWFPWSAPNNPEKNPSSLTNAEGFTAHLDQGFRNFILKGSFNSACRLSEGAWKTATFPFKKAS